MIELCFLIIAGIFNIIFIVVIAPIITIIVWPVVKIMNWLFNNH